MNESGAISVSGAGRGKALVAFSLGIKKTADSNGLTQDGERDKSAKGFAAGAGGKKPCHCGTVAAVSHRDEAQDGAVPLVATFVAQLLGQVLPNPERDLTARAAYRSAPGKPALIFDARL